MALKSQTFSPYPLKFQPLFQDYLWGGHRLEQQLNKPVGGGICAESWELVDHHSYQSHVINGDLQGLSLSDCLATWQEKMVGPDVWRSIHSAHLPLSLKGRFPLLIKFLDASQNLSVQVHPNDAQAALQIPPDLGKTEAWYVLDRLPQSQIFAGLKPNTNRQTFEKSIRAGQLENCLHSFMP